MANLPIGGELFNIMQNSTSHSGSDQTLDSIVDVVKQEVISQLSAHFESVLGRHKESIRGLVEEVSRMKTDNALKEEEYKSEMKEMKDKQDNFFSTILFLKSQNLKLEHTCMALKSEIDNKADALTLFKAAEKLETMTPYSEFQEFITHSKSFVQLEDNEKLRNQLQTFENLYYQESKEFIRAHEAELRSEEFRDEIQSILDNYTSKEGLREYSEQIHRELKDITESYKESQIRYDKSLNQLRKDLTLIITNFESEPWKELVDTYKEILYRKADKEELRSLSSEVKIPLARFGKTIDEFKEEIYQFHLVLARFDELLLSKASKEDIYRLDHTVSLMNLKSDAAKFEQDTIMQIENLEVSIEQHKDAIEILKQQVIKALNKDSPLLSYNKEFGIIAEQIHDLNELLKSKADKADYLTLLESISRKDDVSRLQDSSSKMQKTLEVLIVLMQALTKSTLQSTETATAKDKNRNQVYKHLISLLKWLSTTETPDVENILNSSRLILTRNSKRPHTSGNQSPLTRSVEPNLSFNCTHSHNTLKGSRLSKRKNSSVVIQSSNFDPKLQIDLPPLKYNNLTS